MTYEELSILFYITFFGWPALWLLYKLLHPWTCKCGHRHWSTRRMFEHVQMKHSVEEGK